MSWDKKKQAALKAYIDYYENLEPDRIDLLNDMVTTDVRFKDPFQDVSGVEEMKFVLSKMFDDTDNPQFKITDFAYGQDKTAYLRWDFTFKSKNSDKSWLVIGMSEVIFNEEGFITSHIDHWDAASQLYQKVPVLGALMRFLQNKIAA